MDQNELEALVAQVPEPVLDYIEKLEERLEKAESAPAPEEADDDITKALSELPTDVADFIKTQQGRLEAAEQALEDERVQKADNEWIAKARSFDGLVEDTEDFGRKMRQIAESDEELANAIATALNTASSQVAKSSVFDELGHGKPAAGSAEEQIATIAKSLVEADPSKTKEQAESEAWELNPNLYEQHVADRREALRGGN